MKTIKRPRSPRVGINITREIIERSKPHNSKACMIAEGIKTAFPNAKNISVDLQTCRFTDTKKGLRYVYLTPRAGQKPLLDFDQGISPDPFEMTLMNAHVTRAKGAKKEDKDDGLSKPSLRSGSTGKMIRTGGKAPAQMRTLRRFGIKAFRGFDGTVAQTQENP